MRLPVPPPRPQSERRDSNPRPPPWQGGVLPLNYVRISIQKKCRLHDLNTRPSDYKSDALPTELTSLSNVSLYTKTVPTGIEPAIFAVTGRRDNRYTTGPNMGVNGIEPLTLCL